MAHRKKKPEAATSSGQRELNMVDIAIDVQKSRMLPELDTRRNAAMIIGVTE